MATTHVLQRFTPERIVLILHTATPAGNNSAGLTWKTVLLAAGAAGTTSLTVGTGPGQITSAEAAQVTAGDVLEFRREIKFPTAGNNAAKVALLNEIVPGIIAEELARLQTVHKFYGFTN